MGKGDSAGKRRVQAQRKEKKAAKEERRAGRDESPAEDAEPVDEAALMDRFRQISEQHEEGTLPDDRYEAERHEIFVSLGLEPPD